MFRNEHKIAVLGTENLMQQHHIRSRPLLCFGACFAPGQQHFSSGLNQVSYVKEGELQARERRISVHWANLEHQKNTTEHIGEKLGVKQVTFKRVSFIG